MKTKIKGKDYSRVSLAVLFTLMGVFAVLISLRSLMHNDMTGFVIMLPIGVINLIYAYKHKEVLLKWK